MSMSIICGIDEAGRGPLAGPVVAGAVHLPCPVITHAKGGWTPKDAPDIRLFDSKQLEQHEREAAYEWIIAQCPYGMSLVHAEEIDHSGILESTNKAMQEAVAMLAQTITPTYLLVDGRDAFWFDYPHSSVIKGDALEPAIAAASIIAKVTRDRLMIEAHREFPQYSFATHKGYGSPIHIDAIRAYGPCSLHRLTYLRNVVPSAATATVR
jgi:ribonuclease HII